jgi:aminopeptidase N
MVSLKKSMKWDEDVYGLEYDLVSGGGRGCAAGIEGHGVGATFLSSLMNMHKGSANDGAQG